MIEQRLLKLKKWRKGAIWLDEHHNPHGWHIFQYRNVTTAPYTENGLPVILEHSEWKDVPVVTEDAE